jgi:putative transposase
MAVFADAHLLRRRYRRSIPRAPRSQLPPRGIFHVTARGVARCEIFHDDADRRLFLARLRRLGGELELECFVYCLMTNHFHLLIEASLPKLSNAMHRLQGPYAQQFNAKYARVGHLFQERFHARVVADDAHFARAYDYIRNNPVVAGMCLTAEDWPWTGRV